MKATKVLPKPHTKAASCREKQIRPFARLEDCLYAIEKVKTTKKGIRFHRYWMATWREAAALAIKI